MFRQHSRKKDYTASAFILSLFCFSLVTAQNAADYFPSTIGNSWRYQQFTLDTLQNQITASKTIVVDSLRGTKSIKGLTASVIVNGKTPTPDSAMLNVQGSTILHYTVGYPRITKLIPVNDLGLGFVWNYAGWYPYMKFGSLPGVNIPDTLLKIDTLVSFNGNPSLPLQIYVSAMRRSDVSTTVPAGTYATTPFVVMLNVNTYRSIPPFGRTTIRLFSLSDTMYVSKNNWLVKEVQPSTFYPLNNDPTYNVTTTQLPGFVRILESALITSVALSENAPRGFELEQNFPNPFNPETHLRFSIPARPAGGSKLHMVSLVVFDALGREVTTLVNEELNPGSYDVGFHAAGLSSGIYFYRLTAGTETRMRKMILLK